MLPGCPESSDGGHHQRVKPAASENYRAAWLGGAEPKATCSPALSPSPSSRSGGGLGGNLSARHCHLRLPSRALPEESGCRLLCKILVYDEKGNVDKEKAKIGHRDFKYSASTELQERTSQGNACKERFISFKSPTLASSLGPTERGQLPAFCGTAGVCSPTGISSDLSGRKTHKAVAWICSKLTCQTEGAQRLCERDRRPACCLGPPWLRSTAGPCRFSSSRPQPAL